MWNPASWALSLPPSELTHICTHRQLHIGPVHTCVFHIHGHRSPSSRAGRTHTGVSTCCRPAPPHAGLQLLFSPLLPLGSVLLGAGLVPAPLTSSATPRGGLRTCNVAVPSKTGAGPPQPQLGSRRLLLVPPAGGHYPVSAQVRVQSWTHPQDKHWGEAQGCADSSLG